MMEESELPEAGLKRTLGLVTLTFYGLGTIVGAGIYVLLGSVADLAGSRFPFAFLIAGLIALFTALSYAELSARLPQCAGASLYIEAAWHRKWLSVLVGWLLVFTGVVSASAIANGFVGYLNEFVAVSPWQAISGLILMLGLIAALNMQASAMIVFGVTILEVSGLVLVTVSAWTAEPANIVEVVGKDSGNIELMTGVLLGSFVAFYAFIGFEDMVNVVEEVKNPRRNLPLAIILSVLVAMVLYFSVATSAQRILSASVLAESEAPLSLIMEASGGSRQVIALISLVAVVNGALVQIIMASRVLYGMAVKNMAPRTLAHISSLTQTPTTSTFLVVALILVFALALPITRLAQITSFIMLIIFFLVNLALIRVKQLPVSQYQGFQIPAVVPALGASSAAILLLSQMATALF